TTASGQRMAFVQYLSGYAVPPADQRNRRIPLVRFESRLYKDIMIVMLYIGGMRTAKMVIL
ncbi:hypothetical protein MJL48_30100, partial [Salmonella enterica subsp. enterica serovar Kentucky]|nr:hypothetical protein [Salmonella enterica subsp. enterica serovar Kentucky]